MSATYYINDQSYVFEAYDWLRSKPSQAAADICRTEAAHKDGVRLIWW